MRKRSRSRSTYGVLSIVELLDRIAAATEREMHHPPVAERNADVRDAAVVAIGEEQQIRRQQLADVATGVVTKLGLLPRVARKLHPVQREHGLHEPRAVGAPRRHAAPQIARRAEELLRRLRDRRRVGRKALDETTSLDRLARFDGFVRRENRAQRKRSANRRPRSS